MGRRRKKYKRVIRRVRRIPSVFHCPNCGARSVTIEFKKAENEGKKVAVIRCGSCGLKTVLEVPEIYESVDVYAKFLDAFTEGTIEVTFEKSEGEGEA